MTRGLLFDPRRRLRSLRLVLMIFSLPAFVPPACFAGPAHEEGEPFLQYFPPRDFGATQCLCAAQDIRGVVYVGSLGQVLEYDGSTYRRIHVDSNIVSAVGYDPATDTVFVGGENNLGYLKALPGGAQTFVSLLPQLPAGVRDVGTVYGVEITPGGIFFIGTSQVMRWRNGVFKTWKLAVAGRLRSAWAGRHLYIFTPEIGLLRLEQDAFVPASDDPLFHQVAVRSIVEDADGALLVATLHDGLFALRDGVVSPVKSECGDFLKRNGIVKMLRLRDGSTAVATNAAGLLILDRTLHFRSHADGTAGLHGTNIFNLFEDSEGGIWICLQSGIARAETDSPFSVLRAGPDDDMSETYCGGHWFGTMVLGTATGLYRIVPADPAAAVGAHLEQFPGIKATIYSVCTVENGLLMVSDGKIALLDAGARSQPVAGEIVGAQGVCASRVHPGRVYVIDESGRISELRLDGSTGNWINDGMIADLAAKGGEYGLAESAQGDLWVETKEHGLFRVELSPGSPAAVTSFFDQPGPFHGDRTVRLSDGDGPLRILGSHLFGTLKDSGRTVAPLTEFGPSFHDGSLIPGTVVSCDPQTMWFTASHASDPMGETPRGRAFAGGPGNPPDFRSLPHEIDAMIGSPGILLPVEVGPAPLATLLLIGTGNVVVRMDVPRWLAQAEPRPFATVIRRAVSTKGAAAVDPPPILQEPLSYTRNSVHFEFAADTLAFGANPRFQTRLVNFGTDGWSDFHDRNSIDYLNLPEGRYVFEVRARNSDGQFGSTASLPFSILPPWQRTPWAYTAYALALITALAAFIRLRVRQLNRRNVALETLVDGRTRELRGRETELVRARDDAEGANRAKSAFLANMSHELRTPLNAVLGYTQLLLKQTDLAPRSRERITVIGRSGGHLLSLVNEVLDLSKVEAGKLTLSQFDFFLGPLVDEVSAAFRPRLAEKGLAFTEIRAPGLPTTVHSDASRLRQVLFNLLGNAVKFTHSGGVTFTVRPGSPGRVCFEVADTGVGIRPEDQRDIFLAFHQAGESSLASQGTGLGLTISRRLVELLGGRIEMESALGRGSRFWFDLPLSAVESSAGSSIHAPQDAALGKVTGYEGTTRRLLLVDDMTENRRVLRDFLQPLGFEIEEAADGTACLEACARQMPDTVLLDLRLGTPNGFEVARALRARAGAIRPGTIAISASVFESDRRQAIDAGCDDFLPKPFEEAQLLGILGRVLGLHWVRETPVTAGPSGVDPSADGEETLPAHEVDLLRELSLRGDVAGIRRRLDAWRAAGTPDRPGEIVRRLETLVAGYDMEGIHDLLLTIHPHGGN